MPSEVDRGQTRDVDSSGGPIPADFPQPEAQGAVPGAQPKLLLVKVGDSYFPPSTDTSIEERHGVCADLVSQLTPYARKKLALHPHWGTEGLEARLLEAIEKKRWLSGAEARWIVQRVLEGL